MNLQVGDTATRVMEGFKGKPNWTFPATVTDISNGVITCLVLTVDYPRPMKFDAETGVNVNGRDRGWLETNE